VRPVGCWSPKEVPIAVEQSSGRDRLNIHGAIDLETGRSVMKDVLTVNAASTIMLVMSIEAMYPGMRLIHVFLDNARYHHAKLVQAWRSRRRFHRLRRWKGGGGWRGLIAGSSSISSPPTVLISIRLNGYGA
jgi:hypothetical protein